MVWYDFGMSILFALAVLAFFLMRRTKKRRLLNDNFLVLDNAKQRKYVGTKSYEDERGYLRFRDSGSLVHRYLAEKKLGRKLLWREVVHHIDGNKRNNSFVNLEVYGSWDEHTAVHRKNQLMYGSWHKPVN